MDMKITGYVRKVDKTGRIVLPKEILRNFKISKGDKLVFKAIDGDKIAIEKTADKTEDSKAQKA